MTSPLYMQPKGRTIFVGPTSNRGLERLPAFAVFGPGALRDFRARESAHFRRHGSTAHWLPVPIDSTRDGVWT